MAPVTATERTFKITADSSGRVIPIEIHEPALKTQNLGLSTWGSSLILANHLHRVVLPGSTASDDAANSSSFSVLELGAGTGLVGLSAAALWGSSVLLTDLAPMVPNLAANVRLNANVLAARPGRVACGMLDWADHENLLSNGKQIDPRTHKARVVLAADTVYSDEHPVLLTRAITTWLARDAAARLLIAYPLRPAYLEQIRELWTCLEDAGLHALEEGKGEVGDEWDDEKLHEWSIWAWRT